MIAARQVINVGKGMRVPAVSIVRSPPFAAPDFVRLWAVGGLTNVVLWLEVLAAALFTLEVTGSAAAVALVSAARALPLLGVGALAGVAADAWNRKTIVMVGLVLAAVAASVIAVLAASGLARPWQIAVAGLVSGAVYATEMPARRRMVIEAGGLDHTDAAVAADSLTSYAARCVGPLLGGLLYQRVGLAGAYFASAACSMAALVPMVGLPYRQDVRTLTLSGIGRDFREATAFATKSPAILLLLAVTITMNLCGYSYATLIAPLGKASFGLDATMTGVLAAAEPGGAFLAGIVMIRLTPRGDRLALLMGGVAILALGLGVAAAGITAGLSLTTVLVCFGLGGIGSALYNNQQTAIVMAKVPPALRSRVMGLVTVCIGSWPLGMVLAGELARRLAPAEGLAVLALMALVLVGLLAVFWTAARRRPIRNLAQTSDAPDARG